MPVVTMRVRGMTCQHCVQRVTQALESVAGLQQPRVDLNHGTATVDAASDEAIEAARAAIQQVGYEVDDGA